MRILTQSHNKELIISLGHRLTEEKIGYFLEEKKKRDWGLENYGEEYYFLWIENEKEYAQAKGIYMQLLTDSVYLRKNFENAKKEVFQYKRASSIENSFSKKRPSLSSHPITFFLLFTLLAFFMGGIGAQKQEIQLFFSNKNHHFSQLHSRFEAHILFDYPKSFEIYDTTISLLATKGTEKKSSSSSSSSNATLIDTLFKRPLIPYWQGILYPDLLKKSMPPLFEKIQQGEIWRCITPALLHRSFIHFVCNFLWAITLLPAFESLIQQKIQTCIAIALIAIGSNICQYFVSGFQFLGFSGVIAGIAGCLYRVSIDSNLTQEITPDFQVEHKTLLLLKTYIFGSAILSMLLFFLHYAYNIYIPFPIANTAHLSGWYIGVFLGKITINMKYKI